MRSLPPSTSPPLAPALLALALGSGCLGGVYEYASDITCILHSDCPSGRYCDPQAGACVPGQRAHVRCHNDEHCLSNEHCSEGACVVGRRLSCDPVACAREDRPSLCTEIGGQPRCQPVTCINDYNCGPGRVCMDGACFDGERRGGDRAEGDHCDLHEDCAGGSCMSFDTQPTNRFCASAGCGGDPYVSCGPKAACFVPDGVCIPRGPKDHGEPCRANAECRGGLCVDARCSSWCKTDAQCLEPSTCVGLEGIEGLGGCHGF